MLLLLNKTHAETMRVKKYNNFISLKAAHSQLQHKWTFYVAVPAQGCISALDTGPVAISALWLSPSTSIVV